MSEIKTKIRTYNDVIDLFGEEKAADMLSEALDWSTIDPKNDKKNIMERKPLLLDPYMTYEGEDYCKHIVAGFLGDRDLDWASGYIDEEKIKSGQLACYEWQQLDYKLKDLQDAPLYVDDSPLMKMDILCNKAHYLVKEKGVKLIAIDYVQLLYNDIKYTENRYSEINYFTRRLKSLAKELNIPIIITSQLNRAIESREGIDAKRPQLIDLRDSGTLCDDSDMVLFLHRPEYYKIFQDDRGNDMRGMAEVIIAKHRNGALGEILLRFKGEFCRFSNPEEDICIPMPGEPIGTKLGSSSISKTKVPFSIDNQIKDDGPLPF